MVSTGLLLFARLSIFKGFKLFSLYAMYSRELIYLVFFFFCCGLGLAGRHFFSVYFDLIFSTALLLAEIFFFFLVFQC